MPSTTVPCSNDAKTRNPLKFAGVPQTPEPISAVFLVPTGWASARRKLLLDFMMLGRITRDRHTDNSGRCNSIQTNQQSTSIINPPFLCRMPFLQQSCQFILAWDRHRNKLDCIHPWLGYNSDSKKPKCTVLQCTAIVKRRSSPWNDTLAQPTCSQNCCHRTCHSYHEVIAVNRSATETHIKNKIITLEKKQQHFSIIKVAF